MSTYATQADIELEFGATNVYGAGKWADIDNDNVTATKAARVTQAIAVVSEQIDEVLRMTAYKVPAVKSSGTGTPTSINRLAAVMAGLWLYESRGAQDFAQGDGTPLHGHAWRRQWAEEYLAAIRAGTIQLDAQRAM